MREETIKRIKANMNEILKRPVLEPEDDESSSDSGRVPVPMYEELLRGIASTGVVSSENSTADEEPELESMQIDPPSECPAPQIKSAEDSETLRKTSSTIGEEVSDFQKIIRESNKRIERGSAAERKDVDEAQAKQKASTSHENNKEHCPTTSGITKNHARIEQTRDANDVASTPLSPTPTTESTPCAQSVQRIQKSRSKLHQTIKTEFETPLKRPKRLEEETITNWEDILNETDDDISQEQCRNATKSIIELPTVEGSLINNLYGATGGSIVRPQKEMPEKHEERKENITHEQETILIDSSDDESPLHESQNKRAIQQEKDEFIPSEDNEINGSDKPEAPEESPSDNEDDSVEYVDSYNKEEADVLSVDERAVRTRRIYDLWKEMRSEGLTEFVEKEEVYWDLERVDYQRAKDFDCIENHSKTKFEKFRMTKHDSSDAAESSQPSAKIKTTDEKKTSLSESNSDSSSDEESKEPTVEPAKHDKSFPMCFCYPEHNFKNVEVVLYFDRGVWSRGYYHDSLDSANISALHKNVPLQKGIISIYERSSKIKKVALICPMEKSKNWAIVRINDIVCANDETTAIAENQPKFLQVVKEEPKDSPLPVNRRVLKEVQENGVNVIVLSSDEEEESWDGGSTEVSAPTVLASTSESRKRAGSIGSASDAPHPKQLKTSHEMERSSVQESRENENLPNSRAVQSQLAILEILPVEKTKKAEKKEIDFIKKMINSASSKSLDSTLASRRAQSSNRKSLNN